jgi:putative transposase
VINGVNHWLWRGVDANGDVLDILVQRRRKTKAARRFFKKLIALWQAKGCGHRQARQRHQANPEPCAKGRSPGAQRLEQQDRGQPQADPKTGEDDGPLQIPSAGQRFLSAHDQINTIFRPRRYHLSASS